MLSSALMQAFLEHPQGLCSRFEPANPVMDVENLEERLNIITFGVILDTRPLRAERWTGLAELHDHPFFHPSKAAFQPPAEIMKAMQQLHTGGAQYIARVWWQICRGVQGRFKGSWRALLAANDDRIQSIQRYLEQSRTTFPVLSGPVISVRWLDLIHRVGGIPLLGWEDLSVPLPDHQKEAARKFNLTGNVIHPAVSSALEVWAAACKNPNAEACGLKDCPGK